MNCNEREIRTKFVEDFNEDDYYETDEVCKLCGSPMMGLTDPMSHTDTVCSNPNCDYFTSGFLSYEETK